MEKIVIVGSSGSGKSTLARQLSEKLEVPVYHLDQLFWTENWQPGSQEELFEKQKQIFESQPQWIVDGNYTDSFDLRFSYADTIVFLDLPRYIYFPRIFKRYFQYFKKVRPDMAAGCEEKMDFEFIQFVWTFKKRRPELINKLSKLTSEEKLICLKSPREVKEFIKNIKK
ncbi:DNA topology modulation protein [Carnobacterium gallinarum]|uniref:DNA topology modulation protein n=1 Tax=Carnobacterium gallinarum TaxID=2749 RepID=UPI0005545FC4|nr:DNA topology modulation protein [Carnobacterium gallinarum]